MSRTLTRAIQFSQFGESGDAYVAEVRAYYFRTSRLILMLV